MAKKSRSPEPRDRKAEDEGESEALLRSLREHGQVVESEDPNAPLGPGQTHVYVKKRGSKEPGQLIERRKSFLKR